MKILLAIDGSPCGELAVDEIVRRPWPEGAEVKVATAIEPTHLYATDVVMVPADYYETLVKNLTTQANSVLDAAVRKIQECGQRGLVVSSELLKGPPKHVILQLAESWGADLIVVGSHGYNRLERFLLGSVSHSIATHAKCSVEIVRQRHATAAGG
jgi:nucleotide-binding universal stress UspA family protein